MSSTLLWSPPAQGDPTRASDQPPAQVVGAAAESEPPAEELVTADSSAELRRADLSFEVRKAVDDGLVSGLVVTLVAREVDGLEPGHTLAQRSLDGGRVQFSALPTGVYEVTIFSQRAELSFELDHRGERLEVVRAHLPPADRNGKRVEGGADRLFWGGVGATAIGGALVVGGVLAVVLNPCGRDGATGTDCRSDLRNAWGVALASSGGAGLGTGITMMAIGQHRKASVQPGVDVRLGRVGFTLSGRF